MGRRCALCNCGDWSLHGQRELQCFEPVPDWPERLVGHEPPDGPGQPPPGPSQLPPEPELAGDGLAQIGFSEGVTPAQLFEPTGECGHSTGVLSCHLGVPRLSLTLSPHRALLGAPLVCGLGGWCRAGGGRRGQSCFLRDLTGENIPRSLGAWQGLGLAPLQRR